MAKGRLNSCIKARNRRLAARAYFYETLCGLRYRVYIAYLAQEFDLSEARTSDLLYENSMTVSALQRLQVTANQLSNYYPFMNWRYDHKKRLQTAPQLSLALV